jgi:aminoglycoside 6'-N-acetyltransferase I
MKIRPIRCEGTRQVRCENTRQVRCEDIRQCAEVFVEVFGHAPWNEDWVIADALVRLEEIGRTPGFYGVIAYEDEGAVLPVSSEQVLGFAMGYTEQWKQGRHFYLTEMCVVPHCQRRGIGTAIMEALCQGLVAMGVEAIYLLTLRDSPAAVFYEKSGFNISPRMILMGKRLDIGGHVE